MGSYEEYVLGRLSKLYRSNRKKPVRTLQLAAELSMAERTARNWLKRLEDLGFAARPAPKSGRISRGGWYPVLV